VRDRPAAGQVRAWYVCGCSITTDEAEVPGRCPFHGGKWYVKSGPSTSYGSAALSATEGTE
jgi:hypothetical protein